MNFRKRLSKIFRGDKELTAAEKWFMEGGISPKDKEGVGSKNGCSPDEEREISTRVNTSEIEAKVLQEVLWEIRETYGNHIKAAFAKNGKATRVFDGTEKLPGEMLSDLIRRAEACGGDVDGDDVKIVISDGDTICPVLECATTMWRTGIFFNKKTVAAVFFAWHPEVLDISAAVTLSRLNDFLKANDISDLRNIDWIVPTTSDINVKALRDNISNNLPNFGSVNEKYYLDYNLKSLDFDKDSMSIVLGVEQRKMPT